MRIQWRRFELLASIRSLVAGVGHIDLRNHPERQRELSTIRKHDDFGCGDELDAEASIAGICGNFAISVAGSESREGNECGNGQTGFQAPAASGFRTSLMGSEIGFT